MNNLLRIIPRPKVIELKSGYFCFPKNVTISFDKNGEVEQFRLLKQVRSMFTDCLIVQAESIVSFKTSNIEEEAYEIDIDESGVNIYASTYRGWFYALQSLKQIIDNGKVPCCLIKDKPDLPFRGAMLDISRSKVPKVSTLKEIFDLLAFLKYNHVELYVEGFSFEYKSFKHVLKDGNYLSLDEYLELENYANDLFLDFVPNQNGFGHMADWLELPEYHHLAECEDGFYIWGAHRKGSTLNPLDDESIEHVKAMYKDMLPYTKSKYFNMDFDEPFELGHGKSKEAVEASSVEDVYLEYLHKLVKVVKSYGKRPMIYGDVVVKNPEAVAKMDQDIILIDWGYTKTYPFEKHAKMLKEKNREYVLAGGTSTWGVITCRYQDMYDSIKNSALAAKQYCGLGTMVTDWGDIGHLQYLPNSYTGFIHQAIMTWSDESEEDVVYLLEKLLGKEVANVMLELSKYTELEGEYRDYGSRLFYHILWSEHAQNYEDKLAYFDEKMKYNYLSDESIEDIKKLLNEAENKLVNLESLEAKELLNSVKLLKTLLAINKKLRNGLNEFSDEINGLEEFEKNHLTLWCARNKEEGLKFSINRIIWLKQILVQKNKKGDKHE